MISNIYNLLIKMSYVYKLKYKMKEEIRMFN